MSNTEASMQRTDSPCSNGVTHRYGYDNCQHSSGPGERDPMCAICYEGFGESECTITHNVCRRTFHTSCMDWMAGPRFAADRDNIADEETFYLANVHRAMQPTASPCEVTNRQVLCPMCRATIAMTSRVQDSLADGPYPYSRFLRDVTVDDVLEMLRNGASYMFLPRWLTTSLHTWYEDNHFRDFAVTWMTSGEDGTYPTYTLPPPKSRGPGVDIFQGAGTFPAGVLLIRKPNGRRKYILLTPQQMYEYLSTLYRSG